MKLPIAVVRSLTERKVPRQMAWRGMMPKKVYFSVIQRKILTPNDFGSVTE
jgi:hypothetical protein